MNKKSLMIILLFVFIIIIGIVIVKIDKKVSKSLENVDNSSSNTVISEDFKTEINSNLDGVTVRKSSKKAEANLSNILEITDNFFIQQTNDIFFNTEDYLGKTIKIEGLIYSYKDFIKGDLCYAVIRNTPGCCGADGLAGLDIRYNEEYPKENTWVEVIGVIKKDKVGNSEIPVIEVYSLNEKEEGKTFVSN